MQVIGVGIIGCSPIAEIHAKALRDIPGVKLKACSDIEAESLNRFCRQFGVAGERDYKRLLNRDDISVVVVCLPHCLHRSAALEAIEAGKHLLIEKPIALNVREGREIINACRMKKLLLGVIYQNRFLAATQNLRRIMTEERLGRILCAHLSVRWYRDPSYYTKRLWRSTIEEAGGGVLMVQAIHMFDLLQWLLGEPVTVYGQVRTLFQPVKVEDWACGWIRFKSGVVSDFHATTLHYPEEPALLEFIGEKGSATLQEKKGLLSLDANFIDGEPIRILPLQAFEAIENQDGVTPALSSTEGHRGQLEDYFEALREGKAPIVDGNEAIKSLGLLEAIYASSQRNTPITVQDRC
ncbi:MAG: oxidoreductase [Deltaproteobacteria bacterium]|jgi:predicted dehydrogenase|nr:oxidoreductase [Deltaproteobacteria bacterium]